ncbi:hypothetical protein SRB5_65980 [Streptomyces sp. RB5]|uniref:Uncharacterized protein n=1 Tax=Streptomyces smaragdinus TaxID=2585196 RepID=A0A7K0CSF4_9ACTN|nr:hypothetical protein [Streptomyces smaragdinus]
MRPTVPALAKRASRSSWSAMPGTCSAIQSARRSRRPVVRKAAANAAIAVSRGKRAMKLEKVMEAASRFQRRSSRYS